MSSDDFYKARADSGLYDTLVEDLLQLDTCVLANLEWNIHFIRDPKVDKQLIFKDGRPFTTLVFGEIAPSALGTRHSALGNHFLGSANSKKTPNVITDKSTIKDVLMLRRPANAPDDLAFLYDYQLDNLNKLRHHDFVMEYDRGISLIDVTEIPRAPSSSADADLIATHLGPKYVVPPSLASSSKDITGTSRTNGKRVFRSRDDHPAITRSAEPVKPNMTLIFGGPAFRLVNAKLLQREIVDAEDNLIPPWEMYDKLRPGTVVLMKVQLLTFELPDRQKNGIRKTYQFLIHRIRVVAHSEEEMELPENGHPGLSSRRNQLAERDERDDALDALFAAKKRKTGELPSASPSQVVTTPSSMPKQRKTKGKGKATTDSKNNDENDTDITMTENLI